MLCGKSRVIECIVDGVLNATMYSDIKECIVAEEINARMGFDIWHFPQYILAKVKDDYNTIWQMPIAKIRFGIYFLCHNVFGKMFNASMKYFVKFEPLQLIYF